MTDKLAAAEESQWATSKPNRQEQSAMADGRDGEEARQAGELVAWLKNNTESVMVCKSDRDRRARGSWRGTSTPDDSCWCNTPAPRRR